MNTTDGAADEAEPIEDYLDQLLQTLTGSPRHVRHTLAEVESHLRDSAEAARRGGLDEVAAERLAVLRMGPASDVRDDRRLTRFLPRSRRRRIVLSALFVGSVGGIAIGVAGVIAAIVRAVSGDSAIATPFPSGSYSAADCRRWLRMYPHAGDCVRAMTIDHAFDFLLVCGAAGVAGVAGAVAFLLLRRRWSDRQTVSSLPRSFDDLAGIALSTIVALAMAGQAADSFLVTKGAGAWQPLSLAIAATAACLFFTARLVPTTQR